MNNSSRLLPEISDRKQYDDLFSQKSLWDLPVQHLADKFGLSGPLLRGVKGSHIVYRVGSSWIKLMAPLFAKEMDYEIAGLESVRDRLSVPTPEILGQGVLEGWPYVILTHVEGQRIGDVWNELSLLQKTSLAKQIGSITLELQSCPPKETVQQRDPWPKFIHERFQKAVSHHEAKQLAAGWLSELPNFFNRFDKSEFIPEKEVFLHSDLTWDHFLVNKSDSDYKISGIIDLADCRVGHPEYDIPASAVFIFKKEAVPLREYLLAFGYKEAELTPRLSEKLLAWTCLHSYSNLNFYFAKELSTIEPGDFSTLARTVFPLVR